MGKDVGEASKKLSRRPLKSLIGVVILAVYNFIPGIMFYIYYKAVMGSIVCIALSIIQITIQHFAKRSPLYLSFMKSLEIDRFFDDYTIEFEENIATEKTLLAVHPHNAVTCGLTVNVYNGKLGNILVCASRMLLNTPLLGLAHKLSGMTSVDPQNLKVQMKKKRNIAILPGGFEEATLTTPKENRVYLQRKGFIKYALRHGYKVHPVFIFGEHKVFYTMERFEKFRLLLNKLKLVGVIFWSRFGIIPECNNEVHTVVGKGIQMPEIAEPTDQDVDKYHAMFVEGLKAVYNNHKAQYADNKDLKIY